MKNKNIEAILILIVAGVMSMAVFLPGSQPGQGRALMTNCRTCHGDYDPAVEPYFNERGSMHAHATRDPVFLAELDVANYDVAGSGEHCIRCHSPVGWRNNHQTPPDGSALAGDDWEGVHCDVCHALVDPLSSQGQSLVDPDVTSYGMGMFVRTTGPEVRGPRTNPTPFLHPAMYDSFQASSDNCGICHDVSNPYNCPPGEEYNAQLCFPLGRTYSEWKYSWFAGQGPSQSCQGCHYPNASGKASNNASSPTRDVFVHKAASANIWVREAIMEMYPDIKAGDSAALIAAQTTAMDMLESGASVDAYDQTYLGAGQILVKTTNLSGHKLPTGHYDSHRIWLNVVGYDVQGSTVWQSGAYDGDSALLVEDAQAKIYEAELGVSGLDGCTDATQTLSMMEADCIILDNRIPPRGFDNADFAAVRAEPVGYAYPDGQYWDNTLYDLPLDVARVDIKLYYQTLTREHAEFLNTHPGTTTRGPSLYNAWNNTGQSPPDLMFTASLVIDGDTDGMGDAWELLYLLDPGDPSDAALDPDGDGYANLDEYQNGTDPGVSDCVDNDTDGYSGGCPAAADCDDADPNNWTSCATCQDGDTDSWFAGCDAYDTISGPDCNDADPNNWDKCLDCMDGDTDSWHADCNAYITISGPDCNDSDPNNWTGAGMEKEVFNSTFPSVSSSDGWSIAEQCPGVIDVSGSGLHGNPVPGMSFTGSIPACTETGSHIIRSADSSNLTDIHWTGWWRGISDYNGTAYLGADYNCGSGWVTGATKYFSEGPATFDISAPCMDGNTALELRITVPVDLRQSGGDDAAADNLRLAGITAVSSCVACDDGDSDSWHAGCDAYVTVGGPDCDDGNADVYPGAPELCDGIDNQCPGDQGYGEVDEQCGAADTDGDGLDDASEDLYCTDRYNPDTDGDGLCDGALAVGSTCAAGEDLDADLNKDNDETDPCLWDTDGDGMDDGWEAAYSSCVDPLTGDSQADPDLDTYANIVEYGNSTDPCADGYCEVGTGLDEWGYPLRASSDEARAQVIYLSSEICAAGDLVSLDLDITQTPGQTLENFTIRMKHTTMVKYSPASWETAGWTVVYQDDADISSAGWHTFHFSRHFAYNGTDNLLVDFSFDNASSSLDGLVRYTQSSQSRAMAFGATGDAYGDPLLWAGNTPSADVTKFVPNIALIIAADADHDGLRDAIEIGYCADINNPDTDGDGLCDGDISFGATCSAGEDLDIDGIVDAGETDPCDPDSDGDQVLDPRELEDLTDPLDPNDFVRLVPRLLNYQARLNNGAGQPVSGQLNMDFSIYGSESGTTVLWAEGRTVDVAGGVFSALLGGDSVIPNNIWNSGEAYLELALEGETLSPRKRLLSRALSINSLRQDGKRVETGEEIHTVSGASELAARVVFSRLFASPPRVAIAASDLSAGSELFVIREIRNVTASGFTVVLESRSGSPASGELSFTWLAHGE